MVASMKLAFKNVLFRPNSTYGIQKWLKSKRMVITSRLALYRFIFGDKMLIPRHWLRLLSAVKRQPSNFQQNN